MKQWIAQAASAAFALILIAAALTGCASSQPETTPPPVETRRVSPLPQTLKVENLDNCTIAVSLNEGDAYLDDTGVARMKVTVYDYDRYDPVDIAQLQPKDTIVIRGQEITVSQLERNAYGDVQINGGMDNDGHTLVTGEDGVFWERLASDAHPWQELGTATLRINENFVFTDNSDPSGETVWYAGDFLTASSGILYDFTPNNTLLTIENGQAMAMTRIYTP